MKDNLVNKSKGLVNDLVNDCISRAAAIQTAERIYKRCDTGSIDDYHDLIVEALAALPPAQPGWIPCKTALPKESGRYLISALDGIQTRTTVAPYQPRCKAWTMTGRMTYWKVIAWMPLPEPWKGGQE